MAKKNLPNTHGVEALLNADQGFDVYNDHYLFSHDDSNIQVLALEQENEISRGAIEITAKAILCRNLVVENKITPVAVGAGFAIDCYDLEQDNEMGKGAVGVGYAIVAHDLVQNNEISKGAAGWGFSISCRDLEQDNVFSMFRTVGANSSNSRLVVESPDHQKRINAHIFRHVVSKPVLHYILKGPTMKDCCDGIISKIDVFLGHDNIFTIQFINDENAVNLNNTTKIEIDLGGGVIIDNLTSPNAFNQIDDYTLSVMLGFESIQAGIYNARFIVHDSATAGGIVWGEPVIINVQ